MMMYIDVANRFVEGTLKEAVFWPIHQRRMTIAPVMDTLRTHPNAHAMMMRVVVSEPYNDFSEDLATTEAA